MSKFSIGSQVVKDGKESQLGVVIEVIPPRRGRQLYKVSWGNVTCDELEEDLRPNHDMTDPFERCANGIFGTYSEYSKGILPSRYRAF